MWTAIVGFFGSTKNILMAIGSIIAIGYVGKLKYDAYQAEDKLKTIETKIAKTNVVIAKTKAKAKAQAVKAETDVEVQVLRELKAQAKVIEKEMQVIEKAVVAKIKEKKKKNVVGRVRHGKKVKVEA